MRKEPDRLWQAMSISRDPAPLEEALLDVFPLKREMGRAWRSKRSETLRKL